MEDVALKELWKAYDTRLEEARVLNMQSWALNLQSFEFLQTHKAKSKLNALATYKIWMIVAGITWVGFLGFLIYHSLTPSKIFFVLSAGMIALITSIAIVVYIRQVVMIRQIDNSNSLIMAQQKIAALQASTLRVVGILFLQAPFYTTWWFTPEWIRNEPINFWLTGLPCTLLFALLSIWLYRNISFRNSNKKWFVFFAGGREWTAVLKARQFLEEIDEFKKELTEQ